MPIPTVSTVFEVVTDGKILHVDGAPAGRYGLKNGDKKGSAADTSLDSAP